MGALLPGTLARPLPIPQIADLPIARPAATPPPALAHLVTADPPQDLLARTLARCDRSSTYRPTEQPAPTTHVVGSR